MTKVTWERKTTRFYIVTLFKLHTEYVMQNARLNESQVGIKIASTISDMQMIHTTVMAGSKKELKSLLMRVKEECEKIDLKQHPKK